ncbi:MAG: ABC-2 family transporter protein [Candidatus Diapherotrites archaeon]|nr:ABC-2 family transporter protein [Candidatus Diapherotrites archaeon]
MNPLAASRKYAYAFRLRVMELMAYKGDFIARWVIMPFTLAVYYFLYGTIYAFNPSFAGTTFYGMLAYLFLTLCFRRMGTYSNESDQVERELKKGDFLGYLVRPIHYMVFRLSMRTASLVVVGLTILPFMILVVLAVTPNSFSLPRLALALVLSFLGFVASFEIFYSIGLLAFWLEETWGVKRGINTLAWLLSGSVFPLHILSPELQLLAHALPFKHQAAVPAQLLLGQAGLAQFTDSIIMLGIWIAGLYLVQNWLWEKGLRKHDGKG